MEQDTRIAHQLALAFAVTCEHLGAPDFGDLIDDQFLAGNRLALFDVMWGAQNVAWWTAQRACFDFDLLGETMFEFRHLVACIIDGYPIADRSVADICNGLRALGCRSVFVQLLDICGPRDALELADEFEALISFDDDTDDSGVA